MKQKRTGVTAGWLSSLLLMSFFLLGVFGGIACADCAASHVSGELSAYLSAYLDASAQREVSLFGICILALAYFWGPLPAFLLGFAAAGVFLLPLLAALCGFFPAYAAACLIAAFGNRGILAAVSFFGLRCLIVIPCFFILAVPSWRAAAARLRAFSGRVRHAGEDSQNRWMCFAGVCLILTVGVCADLRLSPILLHMLLKQVF